MKKEKISSGKLYKIFVYYYLLLLLYQHLMSWQDLILKVKNSLIQPLWEAYLSMLIILLYQFS